MEDFKIILYVLAAFAWMFFKNYEKVKQEAAKRNPSKPIDFEPEPPPVTIPTSRPKAETPARPVMKTPRPVVRPRAVASDRPVMPKRKPLVKESIDYKTGRAAIVEGGSAKPSDSVHFNESVVEEVSWQNPIAAQIREADFRQAFLLSEILQRPYN